MMKDNDKKFTLPMLNEPRTLRIKFRKVGNLQYISHLDLQRTFSRVLVRAGLPLWYTKGFNPHIKMVFGMPLPVGVESECEMLDIRIEREMSCDEVKARLAAELTDELMVKEVYPAERKFAEIAFAAYDFTVKTAGDPAENAARIKEALSAESLVITKKSKAGLKEVDILPLIRELSVTVEGEEIKMVAVLSAGENSTLSPEALMDALRRETGILSGDPTGEHYRILRRTAYLADGITEFR
jgi:radical SAM-linked protein